MSYETCRSGGEKVIELDQDNRKKYGEGEKKEPLKKRGWGVDQLHPAPPRGASTGHESNPPRPILCLIILYYNGSAVKSHSTTTQYRQLRKKPKHIPEIKLSLVISQN